ncbi:two-component system sensor histidine kinase NtrB [Geobacter pickeringii]|uniref:histidine kinase n=1 Tax=Geobacter pickeringii TaxID=345632 RepID=A0A0B5BGC4_9BACT|nr:ATP-binding protein [Geobacter pickeringii]AJE03096.1 histidine kinase [Geobacter pickeringii]
MAEVKRTRIDESNLERLLGLDSSKIGFYAEVKQKIQELETANLGLKSKSSELQAVFDAISDGVVVYDHHGNVQHRNHICPRLFPAQTLVGRSCRALFHPDTDHSPGQCPVEQALAGESTQISFTTTHVGKETRYFDVTATPIDDHNGRTRALVFLRDVTEKRLSELQLMQAEKMSSIGMLAAGVAHEINNPLNSVAGYAEALLRRLRDTPELTEDPRLADFRKYLEVIIRESYRCKGIIDSLLSFSRKSDGSVGDVDVNLLLREVLQLVIHKSRFDRIEIQESLDEGLPLIKGDAAGLRQVFLNLAMNALQSIEGAGQVEIITHCNGESVSATISDTGCGIPPAMLDQIWDPFFTTKDVGKGLGLGLAVSYNIIKKHGGEIRVESTEGKGSKFTVRLPICQR